MRLQPASPSAASAARLADDFEREFREFIGSIAVSAQELAAIVNMPDYSIPQVKESLRKDRLTDDAVCCAVSRSPSKRARSVRFTEQQAARQRPDSATAALHRDGSAARVLRPVPCAAGTGGTALPKS